MVPRRDFLDPKFQVSGLLRLAGCFLGLPRVPVLMIVGLAEPLAGPPAGVELSCQYIFSFISIFISRNWKCRHVFLFSILFISSFLMVAWQFKFSLTLQFHSFFPLFRTSNRRVGQNVVRCKILNIFRGKKLRLAPKWAMDVLISRDANIQLGPGHGGNSTDGFHWW